MARSRSTRRSLRAGATLVLAATVTAVAACGSNPAPTATPAGTPAASCEELAARVVDAVQDYVDGFADVDAGGLPSATDARQADLTSTTTALRERGTELDCDRDELGELVRAELDRLKGGTPVQDALVATFRADPLGTVDPSDAGPLRVTVSTAADLVAALTVAGSGSVITLAAGQYAVDVPLVALRPMTLRGPDVGTATIASTAPGAAVVISADGDVRMEDLEVVHEGDAAASVVLVAAGGYVLDGVRVAGGVAQDGGAGGFGIILRPERNPLTGGGTSQELLDVTVEDNAGGGVVIGGSASPTLDGALVTGQGGCGICWVEDGGGSVRDTTVSGVDVGLRMDDAAEPRISDVQVDGARAGLAHTGTGAPQVRDTTVTGSATGAQVTGTGRLQLLRVHLVASTDVGIRVAGRARPSIRDVEVVGAATVGIAVVEDARPEIVGGTVTTTGEVGAIWAERAGGTAQGLTLGGPRLGLQLADQAAPRLEGVTVEEATTLALLANGASAGEVVELGCAAGPGGLVALAEATQVSVTDSPTCEVVDER